MDALKLKYEEYTTDYIKALPEGKRAELIDGVVYDLAAPATVHQRLVMNLSYRLKQHFEENGGDCEVFPAPFAVYLNKDDRTYVEPDVSVICNPDIIDEKGCNGAPDLIIEVVSAGSEDKDYKIKLFKYRSAGVREYWIVNPLTRITQVYVFDESLDSTSGQFPFDADLRFALYPELSVRIAAMV